MERRAVYDCSPQMARANVCVAEGKMDANVVLAHGAILLAS